MHVHRSPPPLQTRVTQKGGPGLTPFGIVLPRRLCSFCQTLCGPPAFVRSFVCVCRRMYACVLVRVRTHACIQACMHVSLCTCRCVDVRNVYKWVCTCVAPSEIPWRTRTPWSKTTRLRSRRRPRASRLQGRFIDIVSYIQSLSYNVMRALSKAVRDKAASRYALFPQRQIL